MVVVVVVAVVVATGLLAACAPTGHTVPPPSLPAPRVLAVADGGRDTLSQIVQMGADPAVGWAYLLAGHQIVSPLVSTPWADHLVAIGRDTGTIAWQFGTPTTSFADRAHRLSGIVVDQAGHRVVLVSGQQVVALDAADGAVMVSVSLPPELDCVDYPAPIQRPTLDAEGRALFACRRADNQQSLVGALVDFASRTVTVVAPPPTQGVPTPGPGILGHTYAIADDGLRVLAPGAAVGASPIEALPFNIASLAVALLVETAADGTPTGRLYLSGIGAQVAILQDADPTSLSDSQDSPYWASIQAERAVALTMDPERYRDAQTLPTLPGFLAEPGQLARTACTGEAQPLTPGSATTSVAIATASDGSRQVDLRISVRDAKGSATGSRHWAVAVATSGTATILVDEGSVDPFRPLPLVPCPV